MSCSINSPKAQTIKSLVSMIRDDFGVILKDIGKLVMRQSRSGYADIHVIKRDGFCVEYIHKTYEIVDPILMAICTSAKWYSLLEKSFPPQFKIESTYGHNQTYIKLSVRCNSPEIEATTYAVVRDQCYKIITDFMKAAVGTKDCHRNVLEIESLNGEFVKDIWDEYKHSGDIPPELSHSVFHYWGPMSYARCWIQPINNTNDCCIIS